MTAFLMESNISCESDISSPSNLSSILFLSDRKCFSPTMKRNFQLETKQRRLNIYVAMGYYLLLIDWLLLPFIVLSHLLGNLLNTLHISNFIYLSQYPYKVGTIIIFPILLNLWLRETKTWTKVTLLVNERAWIQPTLCETLACGLNHWAELTWSTWLVPRLNLLLTKVSGLLPVILYLCLKFISRIKTM